MQHKSLSSRRSSLRMPSELTAVFWRSKELHEEGVDMTSNELSFAELEMAK